MKNKNRWIISLFLAGLFVLPIGLQQLLLQHPVWVETVYIRAIFPILAYPLRTVTGWLPFSLTEAAVAIAALSAVIGLVILVRPGRAKTLRPKFARTFSRLAVLLLCGLYLFMLFHGINYFRQPVAVSFDLPVEKRSTVELEQLGGWLIQQAVTSRSDCQEDDTGVFKLQRSLSQTLSDSAEGYRNARTLYPQFTGTVAKPKAVLLSHYWSYTGITGMYMPLWIEANINVDQPDYLIPSTINHELAHTIGFAREDEAGFIGFLAGVHHPAPDYRYSSFVDALIRVLNSLAATDPERYAQFTQQVPDAIWRDIAAANLYWQQFQGPVEKASTKVNNAFLKANLQADGVHSYGRMVDLLLAWYQENQAADTLPEAIT